MIIRSADRGKPNTSRPTNCVVCASRPPATPAIGAPVTRRLIAIYTVSAGLAGVAGGLLAQTTQFVGLDVFGFPRSADLMIMLVLGGAGRLYGGLIGATVFMVAHHYLSGMNPVYWQFWLGLLLVVVVLFARGGILGAIEALRERLAQRREGSGP